MAKVLVLGCGPAGLLSALAARQAGHKVSIISRKSPSYVAGAQFLHTAIPELTPDEPDGEVEFVHEGEAGWYAKKIYGDPDMRTSWTKYPDGALSVWNLRQRYHELWDMFEDQITDAPWVSKLMDNANKEFAAILSTIPLRCVITTARLCTEVVKIVDGECHAGEMEIVYNGCHDVSWYRSSNIFGYVSTEYPGETEIHGSAAIRKPLSADYVNSWKSLHLLGRYGKWQKGVLVDDAFREAQEIVRSL